MNKERKNITFSRSFKLNMKNIMLQPITAGLYMICRKDSSGKNQVIFAGVSSNLKKELSHYLENNSSTNDLYFCYIPTSAKTVLKNSKNPLYQRVA